MAYSPYVIVGGGMTAASAMKAIRSIDTDGKITLFSLEEHPPYARPPLSKGLWLGKPLDKIWRKVDYPNVELILKTAVVRADTTNKVIEDNLGRKYEYGKLLMATGGRPRHLKFGEDQIIYYRTLADYYQTRALSDKGLSFGIIGGGFIGCELAAALRQRGNAVTILFPENGLSWRIFPPDLSLRLGDAYTKHGVELLPGETVEKVQKSGDKTVIGTSSGKEIRVDAVIAGIGIVPETALAESAGIKTDNGILVDNQLQTSARDVYAAGDAANFHQKDLGRHMRLEHEDNSVAMGWTAGLNMAGKPEAYDHLPYFYSDMFDLGYEAVGDLNPKHEITSDWIDPYQKGVLYYLEAGKIRGILLWNVFGKLDAARELVKGGKTYSTSDLQGKLTK